MGYRYQGEHGNLVTNTFISNSSILFTGKKAIRCLSWENEMKNLIAKLMFKRSSFQNKMLDLIWS